jgi:hypothetical protein
MRLESGIARNFDFQFVRALLLQPVHSPLSTLHSPLHFSIRPFPGKKPRPPPLAAPCRHVITNRLSGASSAASPWILGFLGGCERSPLPSQYRKKAVRISGGASTVDFRTTRAISEARKSRIARSIASVTRALPVPINAQRSALTARIAAALTEVYVRIEKLRLAGASRSVRACASGTDAKEERRGNGRLTPRSSSLATHAHRKQLYFLWRSGPFVEFTKTNQDVSRAYPSIISPRTLL